jgi:hypothetical protein
LLARYAWIQKVCSMWCSNPSPWSYVPQRKLAQAHVP